MNNMLIRRVVLPTIKNVNIRFMATRKEDICTHTGQRWESDDYRMARYLNSPKVVNPSWAVKLIKTVPPKEVEGRVTWCDGGMGTEGHPRVYINMDAPGPQYCSYCSQSFVKMSEPKPCKPKVPDCAPQCP